MSQSLVHTTLLGLSFFVRSVRALALAEKCGMKRLYHPTNPRKDRTCFLWWPLSCLKASIFPTCGRMTPVTKDMSQVCSLSFSDVAFVWPYRQSCCFDFWQYLFHMLQVLLPGFTEDNYIIQIRSCKVLHACQNVVHQSLERRRWPREAQTVRPGIDSAQKVFYKQSVLCYLDLTVLASILLHKSRVVRNCALLSLSISSSTLGMGYGSNLLTAFNFLNPNKILLFHPSSELIQ